MYDDISELVEGRHATGEAALSISTVTNPIVLEDLEGDDFPSTLSEIIAASPAPRLSQVSAIPSTPRASSSKRKSPTPPPEESTKRRRSAGSNAVSEVADAMRELATAFGDNGSDGPNTPSRRRIAVSNTTKDVMLTKGERVRLILLLRKDVEMVDTYSALLDDDEIRVEVVRSAINGGNYSIPE